jgi:hypothetical protein
MIYHGRCVKFKEVLPRPPSIKSMVVMIVILFVCIGSMQRIGDEDQCVYVV